MAVNNPDAKDGLWKISSICIRAGAERVVNHRRQAIYGSRSKSLAELLRRRKGFAGMPMVTDLTAVNVKEVGEVSDHLIPVAKINLCAGNPRKFEACSR